MRGRRTGQLAGPLLALVLGLSACGKAAAGDGIATASGVKPAPAASADPAADPARFAQCMRDNGIDVPDPDPSTGRPQFGFGRDDVNRDTLQKAMQACRSLLPNGGVRPPLDAAQIEALQAFAQCMRDNGVDLPDPDPNGGGFRAGGPNAGGPNAGGSAGGGGPGIDRDSPTFQKAMEACRGKLPQSRTGRNP